VVACLNLAYANEHRPWQLYEAVFHQLLRKCQAVILSRGDPARKFRFKNKLLSRDATVIDLCASRWNGWTSPPLRSSERAESVRLLKKTGMWAAWAAARLECRRVGEYAPRTQALPGGKACSLHCK